MERVSIFIDGCNFYHGMDGINPRYKDFKFDFEAFCASISKGRKLIEVCYYNAPLKQNLTNPTLFAEQQRLFDRLQKTPLFKVILCKRQQWNNAGKTAHKVKGDDIALAVDMLSGAYENKFDTAILISGDGDFVPLVHAVKKRAKKVENVHFAGRVSTELVNLCGSAKVIDRKTVNKFFYRVPVTLGQVATVTVAQPRH